MISLHEGWAGVGFAAAFLALGAAALVAFALGVAAGFLVGLVFLGEALAGAEAEAAAAAGAGEEADMFAGGKELSSGDCGG
jgi:hypothetical protein